MLCLHSLLDGVAIGLAFQASRAVGIVVAIAVLTHDFSDGINTMNIVLKNRRRALAGAFRWLLLDAAGAGRSASLSTYLFTLPGERFGTALALFARFLPLHRRQRSDSRRAITRIRNF